jgi:hypothetical protein
MTTLEPEASRSRQQPGETNEGWLTEFFTALLTRRGFDVDAATSGGSGFNARRK